MSEAPRTARLLERLPRDYAIVRARELHREMVAGGRDPLNLSIGEPELPVPAAFQDALAAAARQEGDARYPRFDGTDALRAAFADLYLRRYGTKLDPDHEVLPLMGSKEGIVHLAMALCDRELPAHLPPVGYQVYESAARIVDAPIVRMGGTWEDGYRPTLGATSMPGGVAIVGSPGNPTGAVADREALAAIVDACRARGTVVCVDAAYVELSGSGARAPLPIKDGLGMDLVVELHSLSKSCCVPGWRVAFAVGDRRVVAALKRVKSFVDAGVPGPQQRAVAAALPHADPVIDSVRTAFAERHARTRLALQGTGLDVFRPAGHEDAGMFCWARVPGVAGERLLQACYDEALVVVPGASFGEAGADCIRMTVALDEGRLDELHQRMERAVRRALG